MDLAAVGLRVMALMLLSTASISRALDLTKQCDLGPYSPPIKPIYGHNPGAQVSGYGGAVQDFDLDLNEFFSMQLPTPLGAITIDNFDDLSCPTGGTPHGRIVNLYMDETGAPGQGYDVIPQPLATILNGVITQYQAQAPLLANMSGGNIGVLSAADIAAIRATYDAGILLVVPGSSVPATTQQRNQFGDRLLAVYGIDRSGLRTIGSSAGDPPNFMRVGMPTEWEAGWIGQLPQWSTPPPQGGCPTYVCDVPYYEEALSYTTPLLTGVAQRIAGLVFQRGGAGGYATVLDYIVSACDRPGTTFSRHPEAVLPAHAPWSQDWGYGVFSAWKAMLFAQGYGSLATSDVTATPGFGVGAVTTVFSDDFELRGDLFVPNGDSLMVDGFAGVDTVAGGPEGPTSLGAYETLHEIRVGGGLIVKGQVNCAVIVENGGHVRVGSGGSVAIPAGSRCEVRSGGSVSLYGELVVEGELIVGGSLTTWQNGRLEIRPGAQVRIADGEIEEGSINCEGTIASLGTAELPVRFDVSEPGSSWGPLVFSSQSTASRGTFAYTHFNDAAVAVRKGGVPEGERVALRFDHCAFTTHSDGLDIEGLADADTVVVTACSFRGPGSTGIGIHVVASTTLPSAFHVLVEGASSIKGYGVGVDLDGDDDIHFTEALVDSCGEGLAVFGRSNTGPWVGPDVEVAHSSGEGIVLTGVEYYTSQPTLQDVNVHHSGLSGIFVHEGSGVSFQNHANGPTVVASNGLHGLVLDSVPVGTTVEYVTVSGNATSGIRVLDSNPTIASTVTITSNGQGGVYADHATPTVNGATLSGNSVGIQSTNTSTVYVRNAVIANGSYGVSVDATSYGRVGEDSSNRGHNQFSSMSQKYGANLNSSDYLLMLYNCFDGSTSPKASKFIGQVYYSPGQCPPY